MGYRIAYKKSVGKDLAALGKDEKRRILDKVEKDLPAKAAACPMLRGQFAGLRKLRVGDYRVIFAILDDEVLVLRIAHRKGVYGG